LCNDLSDCASRNPHRRQPALKYVVELAGDKRFQKTISLVDARESNA
jgi:hypothetical protein